MKELAFAGERTTGAGAGRSSFQFFDFLGKLVVFALEGLDLLVPRVGLGKLDGGRLGSALELFDQVGQVVVFALEGLDLLVPRVGAQGRGGLCRSWRRA